MRGTNPRSFRVELMRQRIRYTYNYWPRTLPLLKMSRFVDHSGTKGIAARPGCASPQRGEPGLPEIAVLSRCWQT